MAQQNRRKNKYVKRTQNRRKMQENATSCMEIDYNVSPCALDNRLQSLCLDSSYFNMVIYLLHDLEQAEMYDTILEVCKVNPYLAAKTYVLSESNDGFSEKLKTHLKVPSKEDTSFISTALAWILLDGYREALNILSEREIDFEHLESFWFEEFGLLCINSSYPRLWRQYFNAFMRRYGNLDTPYQSEIRLMLREMYLKTLSRHKNRIRINAFIDAVAASGQYGEMLKIVPDYEEFYWKAFDFIHPVKLYKLTIIYMNNHCSQEKLIENLSKLKEKFSNNKKYYHYYQDIHYMLFPYHNNKNKPKRKVKQIPSEISWDAELNGTENLPANLNYRVKYWWRGDCGHVWQESYEDVLKRGKHPIHCPICYKNYKEKAYFSKTEQTGGNKNGRQPK